MRAEEKTKSKKQTMNINNGGSRLGQDEIDKMIQEAEKYKEEDERQKGIQEAKNQYENYIYQMKQTVQDEKVKEKLGEERRT